MNGADVWGTAFEGSFCIPRRNVVEGKMEVQVCLVANRGVAKALTYGTFLVVLSHGNI